MVLDGQDLTGQAPHRIVAAGLARSFQITNLFPALTIEENLRLAVQARDSSHFDGWTRASSVAPVVDKTRELIRFLGLTGIERAEAGELSYGGQRLLDMGLALASAPRLLLLDEPLAGLAAAERERVSQLIKRISRDIPVLLVEHDIDRVFALADRVTVMNEGRVLVDGTADDARSSRAVQEIYIGTGTAVLAATPRGRGGRDKGPALLTLDRVDTYYGKSHILREASLVVHEPRDRRAARPERRRQVDAAEDRHRHRACRRRSDHARRRGHSRPARSRDRAAGRRLRAAGPGTVRRNERARQSRARAPEATQGDRCRVERRQDIWSSSPG